MAAPNVPYPPSQYIINCLTEILEAVYGRDVRRAIHDAIQYSVDCVGVIASWAVEIEQWKDDIGLCVVNGKLCIKYTQ